MYSIPHPLTFECYTLEMSETFTGMSSQRGKVMENFKLLKTSVLVTLLALPCHLVSAQKTSKQSNPSVACAMVPMVTAQTPASPLLQA